MNENQKPNRRKYRACGTGLALVTLSPEAFGGEKEGYIRKEISRTIMLPQKFGHRDIELFYKLSPAPYENPLADLLHGLIREGCSFKEGEQVTWRPRPYGREFTVEFRAVRVGEEELLRAVILELDQRYQAMPTATAVETVCALHQSAPPQEEALFFEEDLFGEPLL